ncbi:MAG: glycosyltransferase, partial [Proteobacteria bacterium]|nr:glycosyltransferase [Pseudomonadota bacterium]
MNSSASGWIAPLLARHGVKMIGLVHELPSIINQMRLENALVDLSRHSEALVFASATVRDKDAKALGVTWRNAKVLPQGLYKTGVIAELSKKEEARDRITRRLGLPSDARIVLGVGYGDARKGMDIFATWAAAAAKRWPHVHFVWLGALAPEFQKLKTKAAADRHCNLHLPGFEDDTSDFYAAADAYALSSREDPYPSTALEALAAATPIITVRGTGGIEELERDGCIKVIANADASSFVAAAGEWIENRAAAIAAGERGRDVVRERFGFASYVGELTDLLGLGLPSISVVVPNYNYARHLKQRLESIVNQTLAPREIIFLDDCSSDDSVAVAERVLADAPINWRIVRNDENSGDVFAQWRRGAELAQGDIVWIAEADDWADPRFLETAAKAFQRNDIVLSMTQSQQADREGRVTSADYLDYVRDVSSVKWTRAFLSDGCEEVREGLSIKNTIPNVSAVL